MNMSGKFLNKKNATRVFLVFLTVLFSHVWADLSNTTFGVSVNVLGHSGKISIPQPVSTFLPYPPLWNYPNNFFCRQSLNHYRIGNNHVTNSTSTSPIGISPGSYLTLAIDITTTENLWTPTNSTSPIISLRNFVLKHSSAIKIDNQNWTDTGVIVTITGKTARVFVVLPKFSNSILYDPVIAYEVVSGAATASLMGMIVPILAVIFVI